MTDESFEKRNSVANEQVGHSGKLPPEMREQHPTGEYDDSPLSRPLDEGHFEGVEDPSTLPENMPSLDKTTIPPPEHRDDNTQRNIGKYLAIGGGAAAAMLLAGTSYVLGSKTNEENDAVNVDTGGENFEAPTTTADFTAKDFDFRPEAERNDEFTPEFGLGDTAEEVIGKLYKNWELANEQLNVSYLEYMYYDTSSTVATKIKNAILSIDNHYSVDISFRVLSDFKRFDEWHIKLIREFDVRNYYDGQPETRTVVLKQKEFARYDKESGELVPLTAWAIVADQKAEE